MENATKALLIAAAVLIAIVLISIGVRIVASGSESTGQAEASGKTMATSSFNSQFNIYFGNDVPGTNVQSLLNTIIANNSQNPSHKVTVYYPTNSTHSNNVKKIQEVYGLISTRASYTVNITSGCNTYPGGYDKGYIGCITIKKN